MSTIFKNIISFGRKSQGDSHEKENYKKTESEKIHKSTLQKNELRTDMFLDAATILKEEKLANLLQKIKGLAGVSDKYFDAYYLPVINNCAVYCQSAPASKDNHHSHYFGLITHLLETAMYSMRSRLQFIYKVTDKEEDIDNYRNVYTYAVFVSAMNHDMGKLVSDNRYFVRADENEKYSVWSLLSTFPPAEKDKIFYKIERKIKKNGKLIYKYNSHTIMNTSLLCRTIPKNGWDWITSLNPKLETDIYHAVAGDYDNSDVIGKAVRDGDAKSASLSMKGKVTNISDGNSQSTLQKILLTIIANPTQHSLNVNNPSYTNLVKKNGLIYISGTALIKSLTIEAKVQSFSLPNNSNKIEGMITDHYTVPAASGDTMWWITFTPSDKKPDAKKKDLKCFVFDAGLYDADDLLPEADNIDIHKAMKTMSDEERVFAAEIIKKELTEEEKDATVNGESEALGSKVIRKPNSNLQVGGALLNSIKNSNPQSNTERAPTEVKKPEQASSITEKETTEKSTPVEEVVPTNKFKPSTVKGSDLVSLINLGNKGASVKQEASNAKDKTETKSQKQSNTKVKKQSTPKINETPNKSAKNISLETIPLGNSQNHSNKSLSPAAGVGAGVAALMPSLSNSDKTPKKITVSRLNEASVTKIENTVNNAELPKIKVNQFNEEVNHSNDDYSQENTQGIEKVDVDAFNNGDPSSHDIENTYYQESELLHERPIYFEGKPIVYEDLNTEFYEPPIPYSDEWTEMAESEFVAAIQGTAVTFTEHQLENEAESKGIIHGATTKTYSSPVWADRITPKIEDRQFLEELFGVIQQAINIGFKFNRIGSIVYVVPHGIFLTSPASFDNPDSPLSTRAEYYKDNIRNSSYLVRSATKKGQTIVTGRVLRTKKDNAGVVKFKATGALNGFYLATGNLFQLKHNNTVIKPTIHLVFDKYSVNGIIKLDD